MIRLIKSVAVCVSAGALAFGLSSAAMADTFTFSSSAFPDNGLMDSKYAGEGGPRKCDGENVAPALNWANPPEGTKSFAIVMHDAVGHRGYGVVHWVAYGISAKTRSLAEGVGNTKNDAYIGGVNIIKKGTYQGPCPNVGDAPHHYEFMLVALKLDPGALKPGLTKEELLSHFDEHAIAATSFVGRYARN